MGIETYGYSTNLEFKELKKKLIKFLGKNWIEIKNNPDIEDATKEIIKAQGVM